MLFLKLLGESFLFAFEALRVNLLRTLLSLLGITIGIFTIVSIFSGVDFLKNYLRNNVNKLGTNVIYVGKWPWSVEDDSYPWWKYYQRPQPSLEDQKVLKSSLTHGEEVSFWISLGGKTTKYQSNRVEDVEIVGSTMEAPKTQPIELASGRYFLSGECNSGSPVCILGAEVALGLFPSGDSPLGKEISLLGRKVLVIGAFTKQGKDMFGISPDKQVYVPLNFGRIFTDIKGNNANPQIKIKGPENLNFNEMEAQVRSILRASRKLKPDQVDNFSLNNPSIIAVAFESLYHILDTTGWVIGIFSILVGGFGIANIMFVSVKERTGIIGIQKSLGAKNYFILLQFLVESIMLCLIGAFIGLLIAYGITKGISKVFDFDMAISPQNIILALSISIFIGIVSGFWPAYTASQMDPVEAIRS
jgi:putative ABC transport system permease protein